MTVSKPKKSQKNTSADGALQVIDLPLASLAPDPAQPRKSLDEAGLKALAENIRARGVITPILARRDEKGNTIIVDGERRWRAARLAKVKTVPVILVDTGAYDDTQIRLDQVAVNQLREPLKPMDMARLPVGELRERILSTPEARERIGVPGDVLAAWESPAFREPPRGGQDVDDDLAVCVGCGCTQMDGCEVGCTWERLEDDLTGVCSECLDQLERYDNGDHSLTEEAQARVEERRAMLGSEGEEEELEEAEA